MGKLDELGGIEGIREKAAHLHTWTNAQAEWVGALIEQVEELERRRLDENALLKSVLDLKGKLRRSSELAEMLVGPDSALYTSEQIEAKARELVEEK